MRDVFAIARRGMSMFCGLLMLTACAAAQPGTMQRPDTSPLSHAALKAALAAPGIHDGILVAGRAGHETETEKLVGAAAAAGNPVALTLLGDRYRAEDGNPPSEADLTKAVGYYRQAAAQGYVIAETTLGKCYRLGQGVAEDPAEAAYWYRQAADQGNPIAKVLYGIALQEGDGVPEDKAQGAALIRTGQSLPSIELQLSYQFLVGVSLQGETGRDKARAAASGLQQPRTEEAIWWGVE